MTRSLYKNDYISYDIYRKLNKLNLLNQPSESFKESFEKRTKIEQSNIEQFNIEQSTIEQSEIEQSTIEQSEIEQSTIEQSNIEQSEIILTRDRNTTIIPSMLGKIFQIYNGKAYMKLAVSHLDMVGYKLGEFIFTKRMGSYLHKKANAERIKKKKQKLLAKKSSKKAKSKKK